MESQFSQDSTIQELYRGVVTQLKRTLSSQEPRQAVKEIQLAEKIMSNIERCFLSDPFARSEDLGKIVEFTRGQLWNQARNYVAKLQGATLVPAFTA
ncbi:MAG: hypothetical protein IT572_08100 [Deltaproteobacteria bacterium]|nr:hypothetical protein [Deltaproteobacteria bacterium]